MKNWFGKAAWAATLVAVLAVLAVPAEAGEIRAKVPFSFTVNGKALPPGTYTVSTIQGSVLSVRGLNRGAVVLTNGLSSNDDTQAKLIFHKYGEHYILRQAWMGNGTGRELPRPRLERELAETARKGKVAIAFERVAIPAS